MPEINEIHAIGISNYDKWQEPEEFVYSPEPLSDDYVDIQVIACGICGSDIHQVKGDWGRPYVPIAVGHEIVGYVVNKGSKVTDLEVGDRVGVGAQCGACHKCLACNLHKENNCDHMRGTFGTPLGDGKGTQGGYSKYVWVEAAFAFKVPENLKSEYAAPLMCGGITGFKPLLTGGVKKGTKVGVVGIGGVGHMTILFAKALGAEVTAISRSESKKEVAEKLGADHFIATNSNKFPAEYNQSLEVVVNTACAFSGQNLVDILSLLQPEGKFIYITYPDLSERITFPPTVLMWKNLSIGGSSLGSRKEIQYMLEFAAEHDIQPWIEKVDINVENVATSWSRLDEGDCRFRFVLTGYDKFFGK